MIQDMTRGKIAPMLFRFTVPLVLGNIFQLMYNATDSIIVGQYVGGEALAAVGTSNPIMTLAILFVSGMCMGAGILMGMYYGAKDMDTLKRQISSTMIGGFVFSLSFSFICIVFAPQILRLIQTQEAVMGIAVGYLRIIFSGLIFTFIYNYFAATLRALGDAKTPLLFLVVSAVINVIGDIVFVVAFNLGSNGAAIATVISEALSGLFCLIYVKKHVSVLNLGRDWLVFDFGLFKKTVAYGWTSAMQQATVQLGKIGIQALANTMSVEVMAAFAAVNRIDDFAYTPQQNIGHAMTSMLAQNKGAGKTGRIKEGFKTGLMFELVYGLFVGIVCLCFAGSLMRLFTKDEAVIEHGVKYLHLIAFMYLLPALTNGIQGYFRGIGDLKITLISSMTNMGVRVLAAVPMVLVFRLGIEAFPFAYMIGWFGMMITEVPLLIRNIKAMNLKEG